MGFVAEYAKSGRSGCRSCRGLIGKGALRIATLVQSTRHSGMDLHWFHVSCFFKKHANVSVDQIAKFDVITEQDKEIIGRFLAGDIPLSALSVVDPVVEGNNKAISTTTASSREEILQNSGEFYVEYAKSNQSKCVSCEGRIVKNEVRISQKDYASQKAKRLPMGCLDRWHHVDCFVQNRSLLEFYNSANSIPGISWLKVSDQQMLLEKLPPIDGCTEENAGLRRGIEEEKENHKSADLDIVDPAQEEAVKEQNDLLEMVQKMLTKNFKKQEELAELLRYNNQDVPVSMDKMVERLADAMVFGALERCDVCKGQFVLKPGIGYCCIGYITDLAKCTRNEKVPKRVLFSIPENLKLNPAFTNQEFALRTRIIVPRRSSRNEPPRKLPKIDKLPLLNCTFLISDMLDHFLSAEIKSKVEEFGGKIVPRLGKNLSAVFSTAVEVECMTKRIVFAEQNGIPVISSDFIRSLSTVGFEFDVVIKKHLLSSWLCVIPSANINRVSASSSVSTPLGCITSAVNEMA